VGLTTAGGCIIGKYSGIHGPYSTVQVYTGHTVQFRYTLAIQYSSGYNEHCCEGGVTILLTTAAQFKFSLYNEVL
jgi:hypothetical protein